MKLAMGELKANAMPNSRIRLTLMVLGILAGSDVLAHGGGLNAQGCHNERRTGGYHCHRTQQVSMAVPNQFVAIEPNTKRRSQQLMAQPQEQRLPTNGSGRPTCYTGPRGGTYTLTASGRKNYSGC